MPSKWLDVPLDSKLFLNVKEAVLTNGSAALENCFQNEAKGISRFPGMKDFSTLTGVAAVYLDSWKGDLLAVTGDGHAFRIDRSGANTNVTGVPVSGGLRCTFAETEDEKVMAAGGPLIRLAGATTEILSEDAPISTHVAFIDGFVIALERDSGRFAHSGSGSYRVWDPLDVFAANSTPDFVRAIKVTPRRELLVAGVDSIEQYERLPGGSAPFFRRWTVGEGVFAQYTMVAADNGSWAINKLREFVRFSGQISRPASDDIMLSFEEVDDWTDAWASLMHIRGQQFIILQIPNATNAHGTKGITALHDYSRGRWFNLYGWDAAESRPNRWPGYSYFPLWGRHFVGGAGKVYELDKNTFNNAGDVQRVLTRTAHLDRWGESRVDNLRVRIKRGNVAQNADEPFINIRAHRDNRFYTKWRRKGLGLAGEREMVIEFGGMGCAHTWQFEFFCTDETEIELVNMQIQMSPLGE